MPAWWEALLVFVPSNPPRLNCGLIKQQTIIRKLKVLANNHKPLFVDLTDEYIGMN